MKNWKKSRKLKKIKKNWKNTRKIKKKSRKFKKHEKLGKKINKIEKKTRKIQKKSRKIGKTRKIEKTRKIKKCKKNRKKARKTENKNEEKLWKKKNFFFNFPEKSINMKYQFFLKSKFCFSSSIFLILFIFSNFVQNVKNNPEFL